MIAVLYSYIIYCAIQNISIWWHAQFILYSPGGATVHKIIWRARQIPTVGYHNGENGLLLEKTIKKQQGET